jgi:hypothetical protein
MWQELTDWDNLLLAFRRAAKGKRSASSVADFEYRLEDNLLGLRAELLQGRYTPGGYTRFYIHEPKRRLISAAPFRDRVVHHALCNLIEPIFERGFIHDSYANRKGKGTHRALDRCQQFARQYRFVMSCDIKQFFPSIDHAVLLARLAKRLKDTDVLRLCTQILAGGQLVGEDDTEVAWTPGDDLWAALRPRGLPIGNLTSQFWANVYLDPLDHFIKRELRIPGYVRYVDDLLLFANCKSQLWGAAQALEERVAKLRLQLHPGYHPYPTLEGIPFLGWIVWPSRRRLKRRKVIYFDRKYKRLLAALARGELEFERVDASVQGWVAHSRYGNTVGLRKRLLAQPIPRRCGGNGK